MMWAVGLLVVLFIMRKVAFWFIDGIATMNMTQEEAKKERLASKIAQAREFPAVFAGWVNTLFLIAIVAAIFKFVF